MRRKDWMLPREGAIGRSLSQQPTGWTAERRRKTKRAVALLACATALTLLSAAFLLSAGDRSEEPTPSLPDIPSWNAGKEDPPGTPYPIGGYTYGPDGITLVKGAAVNVTNVNTGFYWLTTSSLTTGFYNVIAYATAGDLIHAEATLDELFGEAEATASGTFLNLSITMYDVGEIPEFPMVAVPVAGMMAFLLVAGIRRRRNVQP